VALVLFLVLFLPPIPLIENWQFRDCWKDNQDDDDFVEAKKTTTAAKPPAIVIQPEKPTYNGHLLSSQEYQWATKDSSGVSSGVLSRPRLTHYFTTNVSKYNVNQTYLDAAKGALRVIYKANHTRACDLLYYHDDLKRAGQWFKYDDQNLGGVIAICCTRAFFGYNRSLPPKFTMQQFRQQNRENPQLLLWYENTVIRLLDYIMKWIIDADRNVRYKDILKINVQQVENRIKAKNRCDFGMFSNAYIMERAGLLGIKQHAIVQGHLYEWALVFDSIIPGFREKLNKKRFFLSTIEGKTLFESNNGKRHYNDA
jgi:hypothetical protein